jgi:hypothetical protein
MTDTEQETAAKKKLADDKTAREKASKEREKAAASTTPTPTQEENDLAAMGVHVAEHADDGSGPDPNAHAPDAHGHTTKQMEAGKSAKPGYQTKAGA